VSQCFLYFSSSVSADTGDDKTRNKAIKVAVMKRKFLFNHIMARKIITGVTGRR